MIGLGGFAHESPALFQLDGFAVSAPVAMEMQTVSQPGAQVLPNWIIQLSGVICKAMEQGNVLHRHGF